MVGVLQAVSRRVYGYLVSYIGPVSPQPLNFEPMGRRKELIRSKYPFSMEG